MRNELAKQSGQRRRFAGIVVRFGMKHYKCHVTKTVLMRDIRDDDGNAVTEHLWFNFTEAFEMAFMDCDDHISFDARVKGYWKGHDHSEHDVKLSYPTNIENNGAITHEEYYSTRKGAVKEASAPDLTATANARSQEIAK